jgi:hypothetical protein
MKSRMHMKMAGVAEPTDTFAPCTVLTFTSKIHFKKRCGFPVPSRDVTSKLSLAEKY